MRKPAVLALTGSLVVGAFVAGVAVGKAPPPQPKFVAAEEVMWEDLGGQKLGPLFGDTKKGPYGALLKVAAGTVSPLHSHSGTYEAVQIAGTSSHWMKGEDGTKAKKMTPGSYWTIPAKTEHVSACAPGTDCLIYRWQKGKYDTIVSKDDKTAPKPTTAGTSAGSGAGAPAAGAKAGSAAPPAAAPAPKK